jgi:hypothetical protein
MNQFLAPSTIRFAGATTVRPVAASPIGFKSDDALANRDLTFRRVIEPRPPIESGPPPPASLPLLSSQTGNLFVDRNDANLHWYLPDFILAGDVDSGFSFVASQSGQDSNGNPFNTARLTLRVHKSQPDDVAKVSQVDPAAKLQEIPLAELSATLTSFYTDDAGRQQQRTFSATIRGTGHGDFLVTFAGSILGPSVIGLYQDLRLFGKAILNLSASYQAWSQPGSLYLSARFRQSTLLRTMTAEPPPMRPLMFAANTQTPTVAPLNRIRSFAPLMAQQQEAAIEGSVDTSAPGPPTPATNTSAVSSGTAVLRGTWMFDLDAGREQSPGDIWWEQKTDTIRAMVPQEGAKIFNLGAADYESTSPAQLQKLEYSADAINGNDDNSNRLMSGDVFAVLTRSGNYSKVQVLSYGYNLKIRWITYRLTAGDTLVQTRQSWGQPLPLGLKYKQDGYQLKYTVSTATISSHVIREANDLKDFSLKQTEFTELKALGDVSQRYPTLSRLYIGVLSRTIVVIPRRYSVVRGRLGCAALCMALVDSSAADGSKCKFEFDFTIAPEVSRIEFLKLSQEILRREDLKGYTLKLPDFQRDTPPSTLQTQFKSNGQFSAGTDPHTFAVTVSIHDDDSQTPAVANANLFIMRLCSNAGADLVGSLSVKLDDGYPDPVLSTIDLNFAHSAGTDEIVVELEEGSAEIQLTNQSPLDLELSRYALIKGSTINEIVGVVSLPANSSLFVPLPGDHAGLMLAADFQMVIPNPMTKSDVARFLHFQTVDVQETQYVVAVNGAGIDFKKVDSLVISITFSNLSNVTARPLKLNKNVHADYTHIVIPLENAVFSLPGTVNLAVHFVDPKLADLNFTMENDFTSEPVLILLQSNIDKNLPKS